MKKRILALLLCAVTLLSMTVLTGAAATGEEVTLSAYAVTIRPDSSAEEKTVVTAQTDRTGCAYQWQIEAAPGLWVDISGMDAAECSISYALVASVLSNGQARLRCRCTWDDAEAFSDELAVSVNVDVMHAALTARSVLNAPARILRAETELPAAPQEDESGKQPVEAQSAETEGESESGENDSPEPMSEEESGSTDTGEGGEPNDNGGNGGSNVPTTYSIVINYKFEDGKIVADPYVATLAAGENFSTTVTFPTQQGYLPYVGEEQQNTYELNVTAISADMTVNVVYKPTNVNYTVIHYQQNVDNDNYTETERETKQGLTGSQVPSVAKNYDGFYALMYEQPAIAADGSTVIEIYYDRCYYLMNFDLDGGYGVEPVYARYGTPIAVGTPTRPGYEFAGWNGPIPAAMPAENTKFTATWTVDTASFTVVFWYENANDDGYSYAGEYKVGNVAPGTVKSSEDYKGTSFDGRDGEHFTYNTAKAETVTVAGDGSTVLNVYYTRNTYTLTFRELTCSRWHTHSNSCYKVYKTISDKYQADIHSNFPIKDGNNTVWWEVPNGCKSFKPGMQLGSIDTMPGENIVFEKSSAQSGAVLYYYVETLQGETGTYTHDGKSFKLYKQITLKKECQLTYSEEFHNITGFTQWWSDPKFDKMEQGGVAYAGYHDGGLFGESYYYINEQNYLCYTRNSYNLKFYNYNAYVDGKGGSVQYEAPLSSYYFVPGYPDGLEANAYEFAGWYTTAGCYDGSEVNWDKMTMPAADVMLYAKWVPKTHTVTFYLTRDAMNGGIELGTHKPVTVQHGALVSPLPAKPENGSYNFVGWFYLDDDGTEKAIDFADMPIRKDLKVYAKWNSDILVSYTVRYVLQGTGTEVTEVAAATTGSGLAGNTKTFSAKGGTELYADYREGYFPTVQSQSLTLSLETGSSNSITFEYVKADAVPYTVKYINTETGTSVFDGKPVEDKVVNDNRKAVVTETFQVISGYMPDAYQKRLVVMAKGENILYFYYTKDTQHAYYKITHYTQNLDGKSWTEYASSQIVGDIGTAYSAAAMDIPGFTWKADQDGTRTSGTLTEVGLELKLYYVRNEYPYQVRYLEQGTGRQLAEPENGTEKYGQIVSEEAKDITGYDKVDPSSATLSIRIETVQEGEAPALNVITFYYTEQTVDIKYKVVGPDGCGTLDNDQEAQLKVLTGEPKGSTPTAASGYKFVGWYKDEDCTQATDEAWVIGGKLTPGKTKNYGTEAASVMGYKGATYYAKFEADVADLTITKSGAEAIDENQSFVFRITGKAGTVTAGVDMEVVIHGNGSVTVKGLKVGEYTVTEVRGWSWRYTPTPELQTITLSPTRTNELIFSNNRAKGKWLNGSAHTDNVFSN